MRLSKTAMCSDHNLPAQFFTACRFQYRQGIIELVSKQRTMGCTCTHQVDLILSQIIVAIAHRSEPKGYNYTYSCQKTLGVGYQGIWLGVTKKDDTSRASNPRISISVFKSFCVHFCCCDGGLFKQSTDEDKQDLENEGSTLYD